MSKFSGAVAKSGKYKVMIGVPMHKNELTAPTVLSVNQGFSENHQVNFHLLGLSLLAKNFNMLFCMAIKHGCDFFILHHSDLGVTGCHTNHSGTWVDLLVSRVLENNLSALSATVAIKSPNGFTSSGLEMIANDPFSLRRLTVRESSFLPLEFINRADVCELFEVDEERAGALLINTGLLIMDIRKRGGCYRELEWPGFNIIDSIEWNQSGAPESYTVPEDWNFSRWLHGNNISYACTRELVVTHCGGYNFVNAGDWGDEKDLLRQQVSIEDYRNSK